MNNLLDIISKHIDGKRTISVKNLCELFDSLLEEVTPIVEKLELIGKVRIANSPCSLDCSSCSTCETSVQQRITENTILISLKI